MTKRNRRWLVTVLVAGLAFAPALAASRVRPAHRIPQRHDASGAIRAVVVTDQNPNAVFKEGRFVLRRLSTGPFDAHRTLNLYIVTVLDRRQLKPGSYDQITRLILPDGSLYEERVTPVDPAAVPGQSVSRPDLGPRPAEVKPTPRMRRLARMLPPGTVRRGEARHAAFTSEVLPVSGTWITKHNLYGTWTVDVSLVRGGQTVATGSTQFELGIAGN